MGVFDKLKNILFEDVEEEEIPVIKETKKEDIREVKEEKKEALEPIKEDVMPKKAEEVSRFKNINYEEDILEAKKEQELEETSPFQQFDEEEFERIATINKNRLIERDKKLREEKEAEHRSIKLAKKEQDIVKEKEKEVVPPKRFTPSPVISPVYGILDKNYKKEDILPRASSDGTLPKIMDVDSVREKAFGVLDDEDDDTIITDEVKITSFDENEIEGDIEDEVVEPVVKKRAPKVVEEVEEDDDEIGAITEEIPPIKEDVENEIEEEKEETADEDDLESDLFNLIDSMYQDEEE